MEETSAGYTIYGEKPLYLGDFARPEWVTPGSERHKDLNRSFLALTLFPKKLRTGNYTVINNGEDLSKCYRFMVINRNALRGVFEKNLPLFKYKLGWDISFDALIGRFEDLNRSPWKSSSCKPTIDGIVLGYGTDNAISWERLSTFMDVAFSTTPQCPPKKLLPLPSSEKEVNDRIESIFKNSDWKKVKEETEDFDNHYIINPEGNLKVFFAFHKRSKETELLLESYRVAQRTLDQALGQKNFLKEIMAKLGIDAVELSEQLALPKVNQLSETLAKSLRYTFSENISSEFFTGMSAAEAIDTNHSLGSDDKEVEFLTILAEKTFSSVVRREKLTEAQLFFQNLEMEEGISCLIPQKLYTKTIKNGQSRQELTPRTGDISVNFLIKSFGGTPIGGTYKLEKPSKLNLNELIPGLAHGLIGMFEGEIREVYIHPDFAYGVNSEFGHGGPLAIQVELVKIEENLDDYNLPYLQPIDVRFLAPEIKSCKEYVELEKKYNYLCGLRAWLHYKKAKNLIDLDQVIRQIRSQATHSSYTEQERETMALLNWIIYQASLAA
ncbi:MAG: FKBP-type peptidyl-prolyl cis-trans isomerase [Chlamydiales bacterium]|nr:FKBP-type peptidyl-prolyl cis-trans isomerase [Chlamydiales bacterium]